MTALSAGTRRQAPAVRLPRPLHPGAWWVWALSLAVAASRTTNPLLLGLILAVAWLVVAARRPDTPWGRAFRGYVVLGAAVVLVRLVFRVLLGGGAGGTVLVVLPSLELPSWAAGVTLGGPVTLESVLAGFYDGLRLATLIVCVGAANALADAKRLLRAVPGALYEAGAALVVSITVAPQVVESVQRIRAARRLRGTEGTGVRWLRSLVVPALEDALERSMKLAAAMDARGYGRLAALPRGRAWTIRTLVLGGLLGIAVGVYAVLDPTATTVTGTVVLVGGLSAAVLGLTLGGRRIRRTRYRPDPWTRPEWAVATSGVAAAMAFVAAGMIEPATLSPSVVPAVWPGLSVVAALGLLVAAAPAILAPPLRVVAT